MYLITMDCNSFLQTLEGTMQINRYLFLYPNFTKAIQVEAFTLQPLDPQIRWGKTE